MLTLSPHIHLFPYFGKIGMTTENYGGFIRFVPPFFRGGDAMGGPYLIETSPLICAANQWTGFYKIGFSVLKRGVRGWGVTVCWVSIYYEVTFV